MTDRTHTHLSTLRETLRANDPDIRTRFIDSLGHEERNEYLTLLDSELEKTASGQEGTDSPIIMARIGGRDAVPILLKYLDSPNPNVIASVAEAFGIIGDPTLLEAFEPLITNPASKYDWAIETISGARLAIQARAALADGAEIWAAFEYKSSAILNYHNLNGFEGPAYDFQHMYIEAADLRNSNLKTARFAGGHLFRSDLCGAMLSGADFAGADLVETCLRGADLTGAIGVTKGQLRRAFTNQHTRLPIFQNDSRRDA